MEILHKNAITLAQADPVQFPDIPAEVENYHDLIPLEMLHRPASTVLGHQSSTYKATNIKNGTRYCLRRIHGMSKFYFIDFIVTFLMIVLFIVIIML